MLKIELPQAGIDLKQTLFEIEKDVVTQAITRAQGNRSIAAELLGLKRTTLVMKLEKFGLQSEENLLKSRVHDQRRAAGLRTEDIA